MSSKSEQTNCSECGAIKLQSWGNRSKAVRYMSNESDKTILAQAAETVII